MDADNEAVESAVAQMRARIGTLMGETPWFELTQDRVTAFGGVTLDFDPYHIDPQQAAKGPFGVAAAQGFLTLSLLTHFVGQLPPGLPLRQHINYGLNRVRFVRPAIVGHALRAAFVLRDMTPRGPDAYMLTFDVTVTSRETEGPVMVAEWLTLVML